MVSCLMGDSTALASAIVRCCLKKSYISLRLAIAKNFDKSYPCKKRLPKLESLADNYLSTHESGNKENWYIDHFGYCPQKYKGK